MFTSSVFAYFTKFDGNETIMDHYIIISEWKIPTLTIKLELHDSHDEATA